MTYDPQPISPKERGMTCCGEDAVAALAVRLFLPFAGLYAGWTLVHTAATFLHISWAATKILAFPVLAVAMAATLPLGKRFLECYPAHLPRRAWGGPSPALLLGFAAFTGWLYCQPGYAQRFCLAAGMFLVGVLNARPGRPQPKVAAAGSAPIRPRAALAVFSALACLALVFTLTAHRSDYDDSVYLQFAVQTMAHPDRPPLTYDTALGTMFPALRSPIYRFSAYENFAALLAEATGLRLPSVYYLLLPAVGSVLCLCAAYLLARWFLDSRAALVALTIYLALLVAWGDTHYAFGNLALVRLYQGKCWLVTVAVPFVVVSGLVAARESRPAAWGCYAAGNIMATGLSINGMLVACGMGLLVLPQLFPAGGWKQSLRNVLFLGAGLAYPLLCCVALACMTGRLKPGKVLLEQFRLLIYSH